MTWQLFNINKLIQLLLPTFLRKNKLIAILESVATPIDILYADTLYKMQHDCRVIYLEKVLNQQFSISGYNPMFHSTTRKIYIEDGPVILRDYIFQKDENKPLWLKDGEPVYLNKTTEAFYHFIINVPDTLVFDMAKFKQTVDYYRLAGKKYKIQTYEV